MRPKEAMAEARANAEKAAELAPDSSEAILALALVRLYGDRDWNSAQEQFRRLLAIDPGNVEAHFYYSHYLAATGRFDEALDSLRAAQRIDPFSPLVGHYVARILLMARREEQALDELDKTLQIDPNYSWAHLFRYAALQQMGRFSEAVQARQRYWELMGVPPSEIAGLSKIYEEQGYPGVLTRWAQWIEGFVQRDGYVTSTELAGLYGAMGRPDDAFRWLHRAIDDQSRDLIYLRVSPHLDRIRNDPRFASALQQAGFKN